MVVLGEVHTGLLQHSGPLSAQQCGQVLGWFGGEDVRSATRPIGHVCSPDLLTGVDCGLPTGSGSKIRGVGTVLHRATITGGNLVQGSAVTTVVAGDATRRRPWAHYLSRPGRLETVGRWSQPDLVQGFGASRQAAAALDLGAISGRVLDRVQSARLLDRTPPFRVARTRLRWIAVPASDDRAELDFRIERDHTRTVVVRCPEERLPAVPTLCEDLAAHDWLLTTLVELIERSRAGVADVSEVVRRLRPAVDHLLHLWMPAARVDPELGCLWEALEQRPGLSRQWQASVDRIRDQFAAGTLQLIEARLDPSPPPPPAARRARIPRRRPAAGVPIRQHRRD